MKKRIISVILCLVCLMAGLSLNVFAIDLIDVDRNVSVSVTYKVGETLVRGAEFSIFRVADTDEWAQFTLCGEFAGYSGKINGLVTAAEWDNAASQICSYAESKKITPLYTAVTDENGVVTFRNGLKPGLYLLTSTETKYNDKFYNSLPCLMILPGRSVESDDLIYDDIKINVKAGDVIDIPDNPPKPPKPPKIPQTGMLWWPVPVLLIGGLLFIIIGLLRRRNGKNET